MHELSLLINITLALLVAFLGGVIARRIGFPTIIGYLLAGIVIGPFTPGFVGDMDTIRQLAELGVIFLMFGVGLHFSFADLWRVRDIAIPGALIQTALASLLGFGLSQLWGWDVISGIMLGLAISVASTVVLLRGLMEHNLINTPHGQSAIGWLVMEDILSVLILVIMPSLDLSTGSFSWQNLGLVFLKAAVFIAIMAFIGVRLLPWLLERIAQTRSRELFILAILAITLGTAMGAAELFGVSLALGAFVAGAIISQSHLSHQVEADVFPFREAFSVLFFVSVGMLVNPTFLWLNVGRVVALSALVVLGKAIIVMLLGLFFPRPAKTFLVIAVGLSQIGEFSFILGQAGLSLGFLDPNQYSLILSASLISITLNPFMYKLLPLLERMFRSMPGIWKQLESGTPPAEIPESQLENHVVIVGYGQVGNNLIEVLQSLSVPLLVIESDADRFKELNRRQIPAIYGDAGNLEVMQNAHLERARFLVATVPDETSSILIVTSGRRLNATLPIITRAASEDAIRFLSDVGANHVVLPELEGGLEIIYHTLIGLGYPIMEVHKYTETIRHRRYIVTDDSYDEQANLHSLLQALRGIEIFWFEVTPGSFLLEKSLADVDIRSKTGASVVALIRNQELIANPKSNTIFLLDDRVGLIGDQEQIDAVRNLMNQ